MNQFKLVPVIYPDLSEEYHPVDIWIDGTRLIDLLSRVETPYAVEEGSPELSGQYESLSVKTSIFPSRHFLGEPRPLLQHGDKTALLICACGCEGCWDFVCKITVMEKTVTWSDFEQVHRDWDYSALGTYVFDRANYETELQFPVSGV